MTDTRPKSSINYLSLFLAALGLLWLFSVVKACTQQSNSGDTAAVVAEIPPTDTTDIVEPEEPRIPPPAIPGYIPLEVNPCARSAEDELLIPQLLMQFFRSDVLTQDGGVTWQPNPKIDRALYKIHAQDWLSKVICLQDIREVGNATERLAIISSTYEGNNCTTCTQYIGWIRFTIEDNDPITMVIRSSDRNAYQFEPKAAASENIGLAEVGPYEWAVVFTGREKGETTTFKTDLLDLKDFHVLLTVPSVQQQQDTATLTAPKAFDYLFFKPVEEDYYPLLYTSQLYWPSQDSLVKTTPLTFHYDTKRKRYRSGD